MPEEVTTTSTTSTGVLPQLGLPMTRVRSTTLLRALIWIPIGSGIIMIGAYIMLAMQTGAWQFLAGAGVFAIGIALTLLANHLIKRGRFQTAGYVMMLAFAVAYGAAELFFSGLTPHIVIGGVLLLILTGSMLLPGQWKKTLAAVVLYLVYVWLANRIVLLPRYDVSSLILLTVSIAAVTVVLALVIFWLFIRTYASYALRAKLIIAFLAVSLISVGAVALYADRSIRAALQDEATSELTNVAWQQGTMVGGLLTTEAELLRVVSLNAIIQIQAELSNGSYEGSPDEIQAEIQKLDAQWVAAANEDDPLLRSKLDNSIAEYLRRYRTLHPENVELMATDRYGAVLGASNRTSDYYQADEAWWQAAYNNGQGAIYYEQPALDPSSGTLSLNIAVPLYNHAHDTVIGVVRTTVNLVAVTTLLANNAKVGQIGQVTLLVPATSNPDRPESFLQDQGLTAVPSEIAAALPISTTETTQIVWDGVPNFVAVGPVRTTDPELGGVIDQLNWRIVTRQASTEVLAPIDLRAGAVLVVILIIAVIAIGASVGLGQILARPIVHLTEIARKVTEGDLTAQAKVDTTDEIGALAISFNNMTSQLRATVGSLEERVQARTEQLRTSAAVGQAIAAVLEREQLLREVVNLITERFGFYYAAVFALDETGQYAVLRAGTGEAGRILKEQGHRLEVGGQSMVGFVTAQRRARIALDVGDEAAHFANPLLPDTRSEIALPLIVGNRVLGALDVQSTQAAAFDEASAVVLQSMADQIAIALNNAEQFLQTERQAHLQAELTHLTRELFAAPDIEELYRVLGNSLGTLIPHDYLSLTLAHGASVSLREYFLQANADQVLVEGSIWPTTNTLSGRAFTTRKPVTSGNLAQEVNSEDAVQLARAGFHSALYLPLVVGERVLGTLNFASVKPQAYSLENSGPLEQIAGQVAVALENQRLAQAQQKSLQEMEALTRQLTGQAWSKRRQRLGKQVEAIQYVRSGLSTDLPTALPEIEAAIEQRVPIARSERGDPDNDSPYEASLAIPITLRGEVLGALQVGEANQTREWTEEDMTFMQAVADQVALALDNARLIEETERRAQRERLVADISSRMFAANDLESIIQIAGVELGRALHVKQTVVRVRSELDEPSDDHQQDRPLDQQG